MIFKTNITRRDFLRVFSAGTCGSIAHKIVSPFDNMIAMAEPFNNNQRLVIIVYLSGGACSSWAPLRRGYNSAWFDKMGGEFGLAYDEATLYNNQSPLIMGGEQFLNPGFTPLQAAVDSQSVALLNQVGFYPDVEYTRSHEGDTWLWQSGGILDGSGIIGRAISDVMNPLTGVTLDGSSVLVQGPRSAISMNDVGSFGFQNVPYKNNELRDFAKFFDDNGPTLDSGNGLFVKNALDNLGNTVDSIKSAISVPIPNASDFNSNDGFVRRCYDAARLAAARSLGVKLIALGRGGWDSHSGGRATVYNNSRSVATGLAALVKSLQLTGNFENTVILTMSEFSRTFWNGAPNPTQQDTLSGSDHGHSGPLLIISGALKQGGIINPPASISTVTKSGSYLKDVVIDFRQPYLEAFEWAGFDTDKIFKKPGATHQFSRIGYLT